MSQTVTHADSITDENSYKEPPKKQKSRKPPSMRHGDGQDASADMEQILLSASSDLRHGSAYRPDGATYAGLTSA